MADRVLDALAIVSQLSAAGSEKRAVELFEKAVEPFGIQVYAGSAVLNPARANENLTITNWSEEWSEFYFGKRAFVYDPIYVNMAKRETFFWRDLPPNGLKGAALMKDAGEFGMKDGFTAVHERPGEVSVTISLSGNRLDWTDTEQGVVSFVATSFMARVLYLRDAAQMDSFKALSPQEGAILMHAALGRTDKEIALALELSPNTIAFYWKNVRKKLGVTDRTSAVAVASLTRQILP
ncbi:MAG: LuxR C-terminal-related transcriptional regulator [Caulobacterales bacterium]